MKLFYEQKRCHLQHNRDFEGIALVGKLDRAIVFGDDLTDNPDTPAMVFCIEFCCMELIFCNRNLRSFGIFNGNKEVADSEWSSIPGMHGGGREYGWRFWPDRYV